MLTTNDIGSFSSKCQKENNEDYYGFINPYAFILCDGVGGQSYGEVASTCIVNTLSHLLAKPKEDLNLETLFHTLLNTFKIKINEKQSLENMASTLTLSMLQSNKLYVSWSGDSRIYQFRNGQILFQTEDHSWVNYAIKTGIINKNEALNHPNKHILSKAIQKGSNLSDIDSVILTDIKDGDLIFHCSDGVLETWNNSELEKLFISEKSCERLIDEIRQKCEVNSKDNSTALLYRIVTEP